MTMVPLPSCHSPIGALAAYVVARRPAENAAILLQGKAGSTSFASIRRSLGFARPGIGFLGNEVGYTYEVGYTSLNDQERKPWILSG
jgi:hypothetical protein